MSFSIFKTGSMLLLGSALTAGIFWWALPLSVTRYQDIARGNTLSQQLDSYYRQQQALPNTGNWPKLKQIGFSTEELKKAYPEYRKISNTTYELTFVKGFDGPYLMWNSQERKWKMGLPAFPSH
jgi:hypothetical protein